MKAQYDWRSADLAIANANHETLTALRHLLYRKRVNVLCDLLSAKSDIDTAIRLLSEKRNETRDKA